MAPRAQHHRRKPTAHLAIRLPVQTAMGRFEATYTGVGLARLEFPEARSRKHEANEPYPARIDQWHKRTQRVVKRVVTGQNCGDLPPLDLSSGSDFQRAVWDELLQIPCGETRSYGEIARAMNNPGAARAVGGACGANPIPVLIPCHRVLAGNHRLGGFSGGLSWKRRLLAAECVTLPL